MSAEKEQPDPPEKILSGFQPDGSFVLDDSEDFLSGFQPDGSFVLDDREDYFIGLRVEAERQSVSQSAPPKNVFPSIWQ